MWAILEFTIPLPQFPKCWLELQLYATKLSYFLPLYTDGYNSQNVYLHFKQVFIIET